MAVSPSLLAQALPELQQLIQTQQWQLAEQRCQEWLTQSPDQPELLELLGLIYGQTQRLEQAIATYQHLLNLQPENPNTLYNLGVAFAESGQVDAAIAHYQQVLALASAPTEPSQTSSITAKTLYNLGNLYRTAGQLDAAIAAYQQALTLHPNYVKAAHNLGLCFQQQNQLEAAIAAYRQAIALQPNYAKAYNNLGTVLRLQGQRDDAIQALKQAIALDQTSAEAFNNLGLAWYETAQFQLAAAVFQQAIKLNPDYAEAHFNLGALLLQLGRWTRGFEEYEWRWRLRDIELPTSSQPLWDGSDPIGKTILIHTEQGFGDAIHFIRYVALLAQRGARVLVECREPLVRLFSTVPGISQLIPRHHPIPEFDFYVPLLSLPHLLKTTLEDVPAPIPYLYPPAPWDADPEMDTAGLNIGFVWAGSDDNGSDRQRSTALSDWQGILQTENAVFYSLQVGDRASELQTLDPTCAVHDWSARLQDFADTAAAIAQLDLVITVDTAVAHLAGALGKPVWIVLHHVPDWRWLWERDDSPWYPTARLFRQTQAGDWAGVFERVRLALADWIAEQRSLRSIPAELAPDATPAEQLTQARDYLQANRRLEALNLCRAVLQQHPQEIDAMHLLGVMAKQDKQYATAIAYYQRILGLRPNYAEIYNNIGNILQQQKRFAEAVPCYNRAIALRPDYPEAHSNRGAAYEELKQFEDSIASYLKALELRPGYADAYYNLGNAYRSQGNPIKAVEAYQRAIAINPDYAMARNNLGLAFYDLCRIEEAIAEYEQALAIRPDYADARLNLGLASLLCGDLRLGFADYEWRWQVQGPDFKPLPSYTQPLWDGSDLNGKTILVQAEQGLGDTIQFVRYIPQLAAKGGRIILTCQSSLKKILTPLPHIAQLLTQGDPLPDFDTFIPLLSLPHRLGTTLDTVPAAIPYLHPPVDLAPLPTHPTTPASARKIGIVWAGNPHHRNDRNRSCSMTHFASLFELPDVVFYSLQVGDRTADLTPYLDHYPIVDLSDRLTDFTDTAGAIAQLDLVITVDTSVAHLAGAMGKPVWVLLSYAPDWRWMLHRTDSPWYPTARLFRQPHLADWASVMAEVKAALGTPANLETPQPPALQPTPTPAPSASPTSPIPIGIGFPIGNTTGWGVYGLNLALQLLKTPGFEPIPLVPLQLNGQCNPLHRTLIERLLAPQQQLQQILEQHPDKIATANVVMLRALGNNFTTTSETARMRGSRNIGMIFSEDTHITSEAIAFAQQLDRIIAGSTWNAQILQGYGLQHVVSVPQGIDPTVFHPAPKAGILGDRFVIFSGGKLEYRKGQDLVIAAFKVFHSRHPDALLLTAWHNPWLNTMQSITAAGHVTTCPTSSNGRLQIPAWLADQGIPASAVMDVGPIPNHLAAQIVREADVALFPNRAEGGTNLVAMECLACGIPTILSANTGHLDLMDETHCYPLRHQSPIKPIADYHGTEGWGESDIDEMVETLEQVYSDRTTAQQKGRTAAQWMLNWTWEKQIQRLLGAIANLSP